jgi:hypothetical protein
MILRDDGEIVSISDESDCDEMPPLEDASDLEYAIGYKILVIRRSLSVQTKEDDVEQQRENIFDTTKRLMSSPKCRSVEVINNPTRLESNHREVNCINYK